MRFREYQPGLWQRQSVFLSQDPVLIRKMELNFIRNKAQNRADELDLLADQYRYEDSIKEFWSPPEFSLLYGTQLWEHASDDQKMVLNHMYWIAYFSQIISAEIATIFLNQTAAAGFYGQEEFRLVCDTLDLETSQERAHINAFKTISETYELKRFGKRIFTYPMRPYYVETMIFQNSNRVRAFWKRLQIQAFSLLSSGNSFLASQYFTVRGIRTIKGKLVQHELSKYYSNHPHQQDAPIPSKVSYHHYLDESFHFNSSLLFSKGLIKSLPKPTGFEKWIANQLVMGCQRDHANFSVTVNGLFWYEPAVFPNVFLLLTSDVFGFSKSEALDMMIQCFTLESEGLSRSWQSFQKAISDYQKYVEGFSFLSRENLEMKIMKQNSVGKYLDLNSKKLKLFMKGMNEKN